MIPPPTSSFATTTLVRSPPKPVVNQSGGIDFWSTRYEGPRQTGDESGEDDDSANDLLSVDETFSYLSLDTAEKPIPIPDVTKNDLSAAKGAVFAATVRAKTAQTHREQEMRTLPAQKPKAAYPPIRTSFFYDATTNPRLKTASNTTEEFLEPAWDDVKHWNRENCGWTMSRERRFKPKLKRSRYRDVYAHEISEKEEKRAQTAFSMPRTKTPSNSSYPPVPTDASSVGGKSYMSYPSAATVPKRPHVVDRILGPGDYDHHDHWETKETCGFVPKSR